MDYTAKEAAARLGISVQTLYAYVSRGLITSIAVPGTRERRYALGDVEDLARQREVARRPELVAERALEYGEPVLESSITLIEGGRLYYRGHDAVELAREATLEETAALIWGDDPDFDDGCPGLPPRVAAALDAVAGLRPIDRLQVLVPLAGAEDPGAWDTRGPGLAAVGARALPLMAAIVVGRAGPGRVHEVLARGWGLKDGGSLVRAALVLCADHELNASAFTARTVASAGATGWDVLTAGLSALRGARHGGAVERVEALLESIAADPRAGMVARLRRGEPVPGFGHPLYPDGDPRAIALLDWAARVAPGPEADLVGRVTEAGLELLGERPTLDLGLALVGRALRLPAGSALSLFALGRAVGWIGQAIEQSASDRPIRPRARYVGPRPG